MIKAKGQVKALTINNPNKLVNPILSEKRVAVQVC